MRDALSHLAVNDGVARAELMTEPLSAEIVAYFLQENPDFFETHGVLFSNLQVPNPARQGTISLVERQMLILRERVAQLEGTLSVLGEQAAANESVAQRIQTWTTTMLGETDPQLLPGHVSVGLASAFDLSDVALRLWGLAGLADNLTENVTEETQTYIASLATPYCGVPRGEDIQSWLTTPPASMAIVPLHIKAAQPVAGVLVIGSEDPQRYTHDMATDFLTSIGDLASAALQRYVEAILD